MQPLASDELRIAASPLDHVAALASRENSSLSVASAAPSFLPPLATVTRGKQPLAPILIADDDEDDRYFVQRLITKTGTPNPIRVFDDGSEVANFLGSFAGASDEVRERTAPRLLFLDLRMHGLGGFGFLEWARQQKRALPMTIVVLSNSSEPEDMQRALELGAHRYLVKYPSIQTFSTIIKSVYPFAVAAH